MRVGLVWRTFCARRVVAGLLRTEAYRGKMIVARRIRPAGPDDEKLDLRSGGILRRAYYLASHYELRRTKLNGRMAQLQPRYLLGSNAQARSIAEADRSLYAPREVRINKETVGVENARSSSGSAAVNVGADARTITWRRK